MTQAKLYARSCKALSHPRRIRIFQLLARHPAAGESCTVLRQTLQIPETSMGHHLGVMQACGLLGRVRRGPVVRVELTTFALSSAFRALQETAGQARITLRQAA